MSRREVQAKALWAQFVGVAGERLTKVHAAIFYQHLDHGHVLGWAPHRPKKPPCYDAYVAVCPCPLRTLAAICLRGH